MIRIQRDKKNQKYATEGCKNADKATDFFENEWVDQDATDGCDYDLPRSRRLSELASGRGKNPALAVNAEEAVEEVGESSNQKETKPALTSALRILQSGANSTRMLREKLVRKGFQKSEIEEAIAEVVKAGYVNDRRLLISHADYLARRKYYGKSRIRMALLQKFDRRTVEAYWEEAVEEIDFLSYAEALVLKNRAKSREVLITKLKRCGYTGEEIRKALLILEESE